MNKERRKQIEKIIALLEEVENEIELVKSEEEDALSNLPESMQEGEKGEKMQAAIDALDDALSAISDVKENLNTAAE